MHLFTIMHVCAFLTFGLSLLVTFLLLLKKKRYIIQPYRLKLYVPFPQCIYKVLEITLQPFLKVISEV